MQHFAADTSLRVQFPCLWYFFCEYTSNQLQKNDVFDYFVLGKENVGGGVDVLMNVLSVGGGVDANLFIINRIFAPAVVSLLFQKTSFMFLRPQLLVVRNNNCRTSQQLLLHEK